MIEGKRIRRFFVETFAVLMTIILLGVPLYFVFVNAAKDAKESSLLNISWPSSFHLKENIQQVLAAENGMIYRAFMNSTLITLFSIISTNSMWSDGRFRVTPKNE